MRIGGIGSWWGIVKTHWVLALALLFVGLMFGAAIFSLPGRIYRAIRGGLSSGSADSVASSSNQ